MNEDKQQQVRREQDEKATADRARLLGLSYFDAREYEANLRLVEDTIPVAQMHQNRIVPLVAGSHSEPWTFGVTAQTPQSYIQKLRDDYVALDRNTQFQLISGSSYRSLMLRYDPPVEVTHDDIKIAQAGDSDTIAVVSDSLNSVGSDQIFDYLIEQAAKLGASDIHIENQRSGLRIRMRIDGALHPVANLEQDRYRVILATLASRANVSTAATDPQSGHMQQELQLEGKTALLNMRVEIIPTMYGQDAVIRLFSFDESLLNIEHLGMDDYERKEIDEIISHPRGMVLMVGPTGSGKSTTLYSMLNALNTLDKKVITLEDPIEYGLSGITQVPISTNDGQTFADGLRSVMRLDPDVVMVGEVRDADTAKTAIQASITGHLVLSSFHANSAAAAFSRMIDLIGINPIFASAIRLVVAQRLVRRLDDATKEAYAPDEATKRWVQDVLRDLPEHIEKPNLENFQLWRPVATPESPFGYTGRKVIMEQMLVDESIQRFIRGDVADVHIEAIEAAAQKSGMVTLLQRGVLAALRGETTLDEVNRVL